MSSGQRLRLPLFPMRHLVWPLVTENLLRLSLASVDVFMLGSYSTAAVAGVGMANQFSMFFSLAYSMIAMGASVVIGQYLGARRVAAGRLVALGSLGLVALVALVLTVVGELFLPLLLNAYRLEPSVRDAALTFSLIYLGGSVFTALNLVQGAILRAWGHSRSPMVAAIFANIVNVVGNAVSLYGLELGPVRVPVLGVAGVALSTTLAQVFMFGVLACRIHGLREIALPWRRLFRIPKRLRRQILAVGIPSAGEKMSWNVGQIVIMALLSSLGTVAMSTYVYVNTLVRYVYLIPEAIGTAAQIRVSRHVGAGENDAARRNVLRWALIGFSCSAVLVALVYWFRLPLLGLLTADADVIALCSSVLLVSVFHEGARPFNHVIIPALKAAGDVKFPMALSLVFLWLVGVFGSYLLGIVAGWGVVGIWWALCADEWIRAIILTVRWWRGTWRGRAFTRIGGTGHP